MAISMSISIVAAGAMAFTPGAAGAAETVAETVTDPMLARIVNVSTLRGSGHSWGFAAKDPTRPYLFIARRENGLTVFDIAHHRPVRTLADSHGANAVVFVPKADRAYIANMDGSITVVRLSTLTTLKRLPVADANLNSAVYEPVTGMVYIASGRRAQQSTVFVLDPRQDRIVRQRDVDIKKIDPLLATGDGAILLPMRDEGKLQRLDAATLEPTALWEYDGCEHPSALAADTGQRRLFIACRSKTPLLVVADLDQGTQIATLPLPNSHAANAMAYDAARRSILIASGADASLAIIEQQDADTYRALGYLGTRPWAHNMVYDASRGQAWLFTMDFTQPAKRDPQFFPDTFSVLTVQLPPPAVPACAGCPPLAPAR